MSRGLLSAKTRRIRKRGLLFLRLALLYALVCAAGCALQRRLLYFPTKLDPSAAEAGAAHEGFLAWRNKTGQIIGWKLPASKPASGSVLVVHGNAGCALDRGYMAQPIHDAAQVDVYVLEYPGYGARLGSPSMSSLLAAGDEAFDTLPHELPKYIVSESLGAGVAAHLAQTHQTETAGLLLFAPYNDLAPVAQSKVPFLPARLILLDRFKPAIWLKDYRGPVKIVLAERDEVIPMKFGRRLFDSYAGRKMLQIVPGAHHNEIAANPPEWWTETFLFWRQDSPMLLK